MVLQSLVDVYCLTAWEEDEMGLLQSQCRGQKAAGACDGDDGASCVDSGAVLVSDWYWDMITHDWATDLELFQNQYCDFAVKA